MGKKHSKLSAFEREKIVIFLSQGFSKRAIARLLNRSDSTIRDEIKRNHFKGCYIAVRAQSFTQKRIVSSRKRHPLKNKSVYKYVMKKLRWGWSPEQICGRLKLKHPDNEFWHIHHETIYRYIYAKENKKKILWEYLPRKQKKRRRKYGRKVDKVRIPDRVSIHMRPSEVENRDVFGHWEGDSIVGKNHIGGIHTEVERKTRFLQAIFLDNLTANETVLAQRQMFANLPAKAKKSTTVDNGKEFTNHKQFELSVLFCDTYASWQKATNENTNGLIRRYLPKKTDFRKYNQTDLDEIVFEINNRPRKCLGYYTPREAFEKELQIIGARIPARM